MKKIVAILTGSTVGIFILFLILLIPILMILSFFGVDLTDEYVEHNMEYAEDYRATLNKYLKNGDGYVPLTRILYFYTEDDSLTFDEIYEDNLDKEEHRLMEISKVCELDKYKDMAACESYESSNQVDVEQNKPFVPPIDMSKIYVTSFFMEERVVFGKYDNHSGWDLASKNGDEIYSVCDGVVTFVGFTQLENVTNTSGGLGNYISVDCNVGEVKYTVMFGHLYPNSSKVRMGDVVKAGQVIATEGTTGYSTGPHLHYQVRLNGQNVDGMSLVNFAE